MGPEQVDPRRIDENVTRDARTYVNSHMRYVLDFVFAYTGFKNLTLALNVDYGHEQSEPFIRSLGTRQNTDATWWGWAGYAAYDWTDRLRTAVRQEFMRDAAGARTGSGTRDGSVVHDRDRAVQDLEGAGGPGRVPARPVRRERVPASATRGRTSPRRGCSRAVKSMDTISVSLYYSFF